MGPDAAEIAEQLALRAWAFTIFRWSLRGRNDSYRCASHAGRACDCDPSRGGLSAVGRHLRSGSQSAGGAGTPSLERSLDLTAGRTNAGSRHWNRPLAASTRVARGARAIGVDFCAGDAGGRRHQTWSHGPPGVRRHLCSALRVHSADVAVCSFALGYIERLDLAFREMARVARRIVTSDLHPDAVRAGWVRSFRSGAEATKSNITIIRGIGSKPARGRRACVRVWRAGRIVWRAGTRTFRTRGKSGRVHYRAASSGHPRFPLGYALETHRRQNRTRCEDHRNTSISRSAAGAFRSALRLADAPSLGPHRFSGVARPDQRSRSSGIQFVPESGARHLSEREELGRRHLSALRFAR